MSNCNDNQYHNGNVRHLILFTLIMKIGFTFSYSDFHHYELF